MRPRNRQAGVSGLIRGKSRILSKKAQELAKANWNFNQYNKEIT
jgi:hypothetical protein